MYRLEPRNVSLSHLDEIQRVCRGTDEVRGSLYDGCSISSLHGLLLKTERVRQRRLHDTCAYLFSLQLTSHRLSTPDASVDIPTDIRPEVRVNLRDSSAVVLMHPGHHFVPHEQAELLLELTLKQD